MGSGTNNVGGGDNKKLTEMSMYKVLPMVILNAIQFHLFLNAVSTITLSMIPIALFKYFGENMNFISWGQPP